MAEFDTQGRPARLEPRSTAARSVPAPAALQALGDALNGSPRILAQLKLAEQLNRPPKNRTGLPERTKAGIEALSGLSMDHVRVHYDSPEPARLNAHAFAQGSDIHLAPGQERHLPHEAWHVVQQAQGRVRPTGQAANGQALNDDPGLERDADRMAARVDQASPGTAPATAQRAAAPVAQRYSTPASGGKLSEHERIFLADADNLFAAGPQLAQANDLTGAILFNAGPASERYPGLNRVDATYRDDSATPRTLNVTAAQSRTAEAVMRQTVQQMVRGHEDTVALIAAADEMSGAEKQEEYDTEDRAEIVDIIVTAQTEELTEELEAELAPRRREVLGNSAILAAFNNYAAQQMQLVFDRSAKIAILTDCGEAAKLISPDGVHSPAAVDPGEIHSITPLPGRGDQAEWTHHFAAIIMRDGDDHVTMESAGARVRDGYSKMEHDRSWTYAMYGPAGAQTFEAVHRPDLGGAPLMQGKAAGDAPLQLVFTYKGDEARNGVLPAKKLPHGIKEKDAARLSRSARDFGTLANTADFTAAIASLAPGEGVEIGPAAAAKAAAIAPYIALLPHLAGEEEDGEGKGGHLLLAMQAVWGDRLHIVGDQEADAVWTCAWNLLKDPEANPTEDNMTFDSSKVSTMFPASWTEDDLRQQLLASESIGGQLVLQPSAIQVHKSGNTFYPATS